MRIEKVMDVTITREVERLEVTWPSGRVQRWANLAVDRILEIEEGRAEARETAEQKQSAPAGLR